MQAHHLPTLTGVMASLLDELAEARDADDALRRIDHCRARIVPGSMFSIQQNVTTEQDAPGQVLLRRLYSSAPSSYPVQGAKRKTLTPWTEHLFVRGRVFVGEGEQVLAQHFDDYAQMRAHDLRSVVNVPLMRGPLCYATFNVFGTRARWQPEEVLGIQLLALAAARWVPQTPGLAYDFSASPTAASH